MTTGMMFFGASTPFVAADCRGGGPKTFGQPARPFVANGLLDTRDGGAVMASGFTKGPTRLSEKGGSNRGPAWAPIWWSFPGGLQPLDCGVPVGGRRSALPEVCRTTIGGPVRLARLFSFCLYCRCRHVPLWPAGFKKSRVPPAGGTKSVIFRRALGQSMGGWEAKKKTCGDGVFSIWFSSPIFPRKPGG